ncbi:MAG: hypothetical protein ACR2J3_00110 [Aridibacter sp.]
MSSRFSVSQMSSEAKIFANVNAQYIAMFSISYIQVSASLRWQKRQIEI